MIWLALINPLTLLLVYILYAWLDGCKRENDLSAVGLDAYYLVLVLGALLDFIVNLTWFTLIFMEPPREWLLTQRVERLKSTAGYRGKLAGWICRLLNRIQEGHCK